MAPTAPGAPAAPGAARAGSAPPRRTLPPGPARRSPRPAALAGGGRSRPAALFPACAPARRGLFPSHAPSPRRRAPDPRWPPCQFRALPPSGLCLSVTVSRGPRYVALAGPPRLGRLVPGNSGTDGWRAPWPGEGEGPLGAPGSRPVPAPPLLCARPGPGRPLPWGSPGLHPREAAGTARRGWDGRRGPGIRGLSFSLSLARGSADEAGALAGPAKLVRGARLHCPSPRGWRTVWGPAVGAAACASFLPISLVRVPRLRQCASRGAVRWACPG